MADPTKEDLLRHYAEREPNLFLQFDVDDLDDRSDPSSDLLPYDADDKMRLMHGDTWELMEGSDVRVLIRPGTTRKRAVLALEKIATLIQVEDVLGAF